MKLSYLLSRSVHAFVRGVSTGGMAHGRRSLAAVLVVLAGAITGLSPAGAQIAPPPPIPPGTIPGVGAISPPNAVNVLGTNHTVTFTCTNTPPLPGSGWTTSAPPGCYDVTIGAYSSLGITAQLVNVTCAGARIAPSTSSAECALLPAQLSPGMIASQASVTINSLAPVVYTIQFSGYVPAICPAGTVPTCGTTSPLAGFICPPGTTGLTLIPGSPGAFPPLAACQFVGQARKAYVMIVQVQLETMGGPCGGTVVYSQTLNELLGPACELVASPVGTVSIKLEPSCSTLSLGTPPVSEFGTGARFACMGNVLAVTDITGPGLSDAGIPNTLAGLPINVSLTGPGALSPAVVPPPPGGMCTGLGGTTSQAVPADTLFAICPTGPGTVTAQACYGGAPGGPNTQPQVCSPPIAFTYIGCPSGSICIPPSGGICPPGYAAQGSPPSLCVTNVATVQAAIETTLTAAGVGSPGHPGGRSYLKQLEAVQQDLAAGRNDQALLDLQSLLCHIRAQTGKQIPAATASVLESEIALYDTLLGGSPPLSC